MITDKNSMKEFEYKKTPRKQNKNTNTKYGREKLRKLKTHFQKFKNWKLIIAKGQKTEYIGKEPSILQKTTPELKNVSFQTEKKSHMCLVQRMYIDTQVKY
jgi:hypothetical protein